MNNVLVGINICEDIWHKKGPAYIQSHAGAEVIINLNASPYESGKPLVRQKILAERSFENKIIIVYLNAVGGQDELVFDGFSMIYDQNGRLVARCRQFEEEMGVFDLDIEQVRKSRRIQALSAGKISAKTAAVERIKIPAYIHPDRKSIKFRAVQPMMKPEEEIYKALVLGTSDYVMKNRFKRVIIGLSGGIDSSLVAAIAVDALGRDNVAGRMRFSSRATLE
jgi:NAD+ synthase (glutamine-hydrolysing)